MGFIDDKNESKLDAGTPQSRTSYTSMVYSVAILSTLVQVVSVQTHGIDAKCEVVIGYLEFSCTRQKKLADEGERVDRV